MHAQFILFDGYDALDVIGPYETILAGGDASGGLITAELASAEGPRPVPAGMGGIELAATAELDPQRADLVVIPGAAAPLSSGGGEQIARLLEQAVASPLGAKLESAVRREECTVATVCDGSLLLGMTGLLAGRNATTNRMGLDQLAGTGATVVDARVVDDGDLVTAQGIVSGVDLALHLLEREAGPLIARSVEDLFAHERRGTAWRHRGAVPVRS